MPPAICMLVVIDQVKPCMLRQSSEQSHCVVDHVLVRLELAVSEACHALQSSSERVPGTKQVIVCWIRFSATGTASDLESTML